MIDPIALRKKLARLGIGPKFQFSQTAAMDAARDFGNHAATNTGIVVAEDIEVSAIVRGDVDCTCPKCLHQFTIEGASIEDDAIPVDASDIVDSVEVLSETDSIAPGTCVLEPTEIAYMIHAWAMLWDLPA